MEEKFGYYQDLKNGHGIIRARITGQLRSWDIPRSLSALEALKEEWGNLEYPGIYMLFETLGKKVYIGEAKNIFNRLKTHMTSPDDKIKRWDKAVIINDGRSAMQSDFNDAVIRKSLELYLINLLKANRYKVVAQGEPQKHNPHQKSVVKALKEEFDFLLMKKNLITRFIGKLGQEEIHRDELKKLLKKMGYKIKKWQATEAIIDETIAYIRSGSPKPKNNPKHWQITFRDEFKDSLQKGGGYLLVSRDGVLLIPLKEVQKVVTDPSTYKQKTIDIYVNFKDDAIKLTYKKDKIDVTRYRLLK